MGWYNWRPFLLVIHVETEDEQAHHLVHFSTEKTLEPTPCTLYGDVPFSCDLSLEELLEGKPDGWYTIQGTLSDNYFEYQGDYSACGTATVTAMPVVCKGCGTVDPVDPCTECAEERRYFEALLDT